LKKVKLTLIEIFYTNFFFSVCCYLWFWSLRSSLFAKPLFPDSSFASSQLSIFFRSLLFTGLQPLFSLPLVLFHHGLIVTNFNCDSFFLRVSTLVTFFSLLFLKPPLRNRKHNMHNGGTHPSHHAPILFFFGEFSLFFNKNFGIKKKL
jgi:hypothetical protein